jgi:hypothetical protein
VPFSLSAIVSLGRALMTKWRGLGGCREPDITHAAEKPRRKSSRRHAANATAGIEPPFASLRQATFRIAGAVEGRATSFR